jgi:Activator of Hsp90 ATPase homolog 1-like protein
MQARAAGTTKAQSFTTSFTVDQRPDVVYVAINNVRDWWSGDNEGSPDTVGGVFTHRYEDMHRCKIEVVELVPNRKVAWLVLDNYFDFIEDKTEWKGTKMVFDIAEKGAKTEVRFTHEGLVPEYECFNVCSNAWGSIINGDLRSLIATGKGSPNLKEDRKAS